MIGGGLTNSGSMPISANGGPATSGSDGASDGTMTVGGINMGGGGGISTSVIAVVVLALLAGWYLWKKK
ncbi:hypothetical protein HGP28_10700 [Vibrio sp. SM6]|uniref:Uncharacterized protein n=1 Tax=Vibrio agarilyticus TaxID=2726741 RepID=A0A7X8YHD6_9VIBR|nr:hypothetical protein [Vibrio agarilyticus]NLS13361.1 hypothetical protein [Vibrio agarilyticus]